RRPRLGRRRGDRVGSARPPSVSRAARSAAAARATRRRASAMSPGEVDPVCIVVAEPPEAQLGTLAALRRLGPDVRIERVHDADACAARVRDARPDLVVVDRALGGEGARILIGLRGSGPPALVVTPEATADAALETFRAGAADCVTAGLDFADVLPAVALEQIRAWRATRERDRLRSDARALRVTLENLVEAMESGLLVLDAEGCVTHANPAAERILAEPRGALLGRPIAEWLPGAAAGSAGLASALRAGERVRGAEAVVALRDGRYVPVGLSLAP